MYIYIYVCFAFDYRTYTYVILYLHVFKSKYMIHVYHVEVSYNRGTPKCLGWFICWKSLIQHDVAVQYPYCRKPACVMSQIMGNSWATSRNYM